MQHRLLSVNGVQQAAGLGRAGQRWVGGHVQTQKDKFEVIPSQTRAHDLGPGWCDVAEGSHSLRNRKRSQ